jgi:hypothetical protein
MPVLCPVREGELDVGGGGAPDGDTPELDPVWAALLGDGERLREDLQPSRIFLTNGERKGLSFWLDMLESGCKAVYSSYRKGSVRCAVRAAPYYASRVFSHTFSLLTKKCNTPNGNRTRAACLEGKHDNHFTIGVLNYND